MRSKIANLTERLESAETRADADRDVAAKAKLEAKRARKGSKEARKVAKASRKVAKALRREFEKCDVMVKAAEAATKRAAAAQKAKAKTRPTRIPKAAAPAEVKGKQASPVITNPAV